MYLERRRLSSTIRQAANPTVLHHTGCWWIKLTSSRMRSGQPFTEPCNFFPNTTRNIDFLDESRVTNVFIVTVTSHTSLE